MEGICENGQCQDTEGGFCCACDFGYVLSEDKTTCEGRFPLSYWKLCVTVIPV